MIRKSLSIQKYNSDHYSLTVDWLNDEYLQDTFGLTYKVSLDDHKKWLIENPCVEFLPLYVGTDYVGNVVLTHQKRHSSSYLQIYIGNSDFRGKGLGKDFMQLALGHCFEKLNIHRVWLHVRESNHVAIKLYEGLSFQREGVERESVLVKNKFLNQIRMSILRDDFISEEI